jgi:HAD superfamily hydrolase (TIGR01509 family)
MVTSSSTAYDAVLFDLDGVLVDTTALHGRVWSEFGSFHGYAPTRAELLATNGLRAGVVVQAWLGPGLGDEAVAALVAEREVLFNRLLSVEPMAAVPGAADFVGALASAGVPMAVATSAVPANAELALARIGLRRAFSAVVTAPDVSKGKPDPECWLKAAALLGVAPGRCLVVEDSISGIRAARAAGARCLALETTFPREALLQEGPDWVVADLRTIPRELVPRQGAAGARR